MKNKLSIYRREEICYNYFVWHDGDELVATVRIMDIDTERWITNVFISPSYRQRGLCYDLLDIATILGGCKISVRKQNKIALHTYLRYGFTVFDENEEYLYLRI